MEIVQKLKEAFQSKAGQKMEAPWELLKAPELYDNDYFYVGDDIKRILKYENQPTGITRLNRHCMDWTEMEDDILRKFANSEEVSHDNIAMTLGRTKNSVHTRYSAVINCES